MKFDKINNFIHEEFDRVKFSLCDQYWYTGKYDSFVNIEHSILYIHENVQDNVLNIIEL